MKIMFAALLLLAPKFLNAQVETENPFKDYVGTYSTIKVDCTGDVDTSELTGMKILSHGLPGKLVLSIGNRSWELRDGDFMVDGKVHVRNKIIVTPLGVVFDGLKREFYGEGVPIKSSLVFGIKEAENEDEYQVIESYVGIGFNYEIFSQYLSRSHSCNWLLRKQP